MHPVRLPSRSPNLNAYAERFVRSIKSECLGQVIPIGEAHLRRAVREYVEHYHPSAITRGLATGSSTRLPMDHEESVRSNAARGLAGFFGSTVEPRRARLSFGTLRDPKSSVD